MANLATTMVQRILREVGGRSDTRAFRNNTGKLYSPEADRWIEFGLCPGSSDIIGLHASTCPKCGHGPLALFTALEVKTGAGRLTTQQRNFIDMVRRFGGIAECVHSEAEALAALTQGRIRHG